MANKQRLIELLETIKSKITDNTEVVRTRYDSVDSMIKDLDRLIEGIREDDKHVYRELELFFAPTGSFQELSISNGWGDEFLLIAENFDNLE